MIANPEQDFVLKTVESRDVHFVRLWFTDVLGRMKSFAVVPGELEDAFTDGMGFDASCIKGFSRAQGADMLAFPDASTFQVLPWRPEANAVARMFCNIKMPDGRPFEGDPRRVLMRAVQRAADAGFEFNVGPELEYFYFKSAHEPEVLDQGSYFDLTTLDYASDLRRDTVLTLEKMGIPVKYSHHETGPSQHEIDLRHADALSMADAVMTYKLVVKEIAIKHGVHASFMPKPLASAPGSAMHVHQSLSDLDGNNVFFDAGDPSGCNLSATAKSYIAGLLKYAPEFCLVTNQHVNSYKRLTGDDAPLCLSWARHNRSAIVHIPGSRPARASSCRVELVSPDPAANPYLAFAVMLSAGLKGIEDGLELPPSLDELAGGQEGAGTSLGLGSGSGARIPATRQELRAAGYEVLPETLGEAVERFAESAFAREVLGRHIHAYLVEAKRAEWADYQASISPWEIEHDLAVL